MGFMKHQHFKGIFQAPGYFTKPSKKVFVKIHHFKGLHKAVRGFTKPVSKGIQWALKGLCKAQVFQGALKDFVKPIVSRVLRSLILQGALPKFQSFDGLAKPLGASYTKQMFQFFLQMKKDYFSKLPRLSQSPLDLCKALGNWSFVKPLYRGGGFIKSESRWGFMESRGCFPKTLWPSQSYYI